MRDLSGFATRELGKQMNGSLLEVFLTSEAHIIANSKALGMLVSPAAESGVTRRPDDAVETLPATETSRYFRLWAVPPVE